MATKISKIINLVSNMGWRYIGFRIVHEILKKSGLFKNRFQVNPPYTQYITLDQWKNQSVQFFFKDKESLSFPRIPNDELKTNFENIKAGKLLLFNSLLSDLGINYDWVTNPDTGYVYDKNKHWTEIADFSTQAGDIKYVWEKSRFSFLYDIIRYDYHFNINCSELVFASILSWIKANPINCGPNYRCSQEISLRIINWTFALHYYKNAPALTNEIFNQIQFAVYWQIQHVYKNINFSRIAVRNNHAITETLTLYLVGLLYPTLPDAQEIKRKGKKWFEEEIAYQIYTDGTFLQFSMNYHRVVVQLLTWAITLSEKNNEQFNDTVYTRAKKSILFLSTCMNDENGWLPNYGNNDGALFFKLNQSHYRDYRPQLYALANALRINLGASNSTEDSLWYGNTNKLIEVCKPANGTYSFDKGGYYIIRETDTLTFIRCGSYKDRPHQADNLHIDLWYKGENILLDAGSYKYNTDEATLRYFSGTASHNTIMLDDYDQMLKGKRFIWYFWTRSLKSVLQEDKDAYSFVGEISAFRHINKGILHWRFLIKIKDKPIWIIRDKIIDAPDTLKMKQLWHLPINGKYHLNFSAKNELEEPLTPQIKTGWFSSFYSQKQQSQEIFFSTDDNFIETIIEVKL